MGHGEGWGLVLQILTLGVVTPVEEVWTGCGNFLFPFICQMHIQMDDLCVLFRRTDPQFIDYSTHGVYFCVQIQSCFLQKVYITLLPHVLLRYHLLRLHLLLRWRHLLLLYLEQLTNQRSQLLLLRRHLRLRHLHLLFIVGIHLLLA